MKGKYLITTDDWFTAPDGKQYQAVWGNCEPVTDAIMGIKTNARSTNWFIMVKGEKEKVLIAGCKIHYAVECERPATERSDYWSIEAGELKEFTTPTRIYIPK